MRNEYFGGEKIRDKNYNVVLLYNISRIIRVRGLKDSAIAAKAGYSKQQFNARLNWRKIIKPSNAVAIAIANALNVSMNELYEQSADAEELTETCKKVRLWRLFAYMGII